MERFIKIVIVYDNELELHLEGLKHSISYDPEANELSFKNSGNGKVTLNTLYAKTIIIDDKIVKGNVMYYC